MPPNFATELLIWRAALSVRVMATSSFSGMSGGHRAALLAHVHHRHGRRPLAPLGDEVGELDRAQVLEDAVVQPRPQVVREALLIVVAVLLAPALRGVHRLVDGAGDVRDRDLVEVLGEEVAAARAADARDDRIPAQLPEELLEVRERDALPLADSRQRHRPALLGLGQGEVEDGGDGEAAFRGQTHVCLQFGVGASAAQRERPRNAVKFTKNPTVLINLSGNRAPGTGCQPGPEGFAIILSSIY